MVKSKKINVGISIGDPNGIGIEVMLKALSERPSNDNCNYIIYSSHELIVNQKKDLNIKSLPLKKIESFDTTTVRASVGNYLVSKWIKEHSDAKVIFNGDGSDEVSGGYMYFHAAPNPTDFDLDCRRLLNEIHFFDVLRSDRSIRAVIGTLDQLPSA